MATIVFPRVKSNLPSLPKKLNFISVTFVTLCSHLSITKPIPNPNPDAPYIRKEQFVMALFKRCQTMKDFNKMHAHIIRTGFEQNLFVVGKIIAFCATSEHGDMGYAVSVFEKIENPDAFLWNTMIRGFENTNRLDLAFLYFKRLQRKGEVADNFTYSFLLKGAGRLGLVPLGKQIHGNVVKCGFESNAFVKVTLLRMYGLFKDIRTAHQLFEEISDPEVVAWNAIIACHVSCGNYNEALDLFERMLQCNIYPDEGTLVVTFRACSASGALNFGRKLHSAINHTDLVNVTSVSNSIIDMYAKCGAIEEAYRRFCEMSGRDMVSWNAMIVGLAVHGHAEEALVLFTKMIEENLQTPNHVTFLGVLCACSHAGMVNEGRRYFEMMKQEYHLQPEIRHYGCMVDILGRGGFVEEAYQMAKGMPMGYNSIVLRTLLAACRVHGNIQLAEKVRRHLLELEPDHSSDYVLLSNLYASLGKWDRVMEVRESMRGSGANKPSAGNSFISTNECFQR